MCASLKVLEEELAVDTREDLLCPVENFVEPAGNVTGEATADKGPAPSGR